MHADSTVLHFGVLPLPPMGCAAIGGHARPDEFRTIATWGSLSAHVAGTWTEWGIDPDAEYADESLHVFVTVPEDAASGGPLDELADHVREWLAGLLHPQSRLTDYAVATDVEDDHPRVVTFQSSGPNVWARAPQGDASAFTEEDRRILSA